MGLGTSAMESRQAAPVTREAGPMILIEGLDLAGKSTLFARIQDTLEGSWKLRWSRNCLVPENPINERAQELRKLKQPGSGISPLETGSLFLASHMWDLCNFQPPEADTVHLQDSSWLRTVAYHSEAFTPTPFVQEGLPWTLGSFGDLAAQVMGEEKTTSGPAFDVVIFLTASAEERQGRLDERRQKNPEDCDYDDALVIRDPAKFMKLDSLLWEVTLRRFPHARKIDSTGKSRDQVFQEASATISSCVSGPLKVAFEAVVP
ncbi:unnamed protein product [Symbiodinium pilosum]|uniref:Thymidylate kinase n=1 Tax=Symbiodinium pilosum TaxID=2952 RepID=A0A812LIF7_SYMPI|nr:unnamed protein product [Symbiodinium pilosum]